MLLSAGTDVTKWNFGQHDPAGDEEFGFCDATNFLGDENYTENDDPGSIDEITLSTKDSDEESTTCELDIDFDAIWE
jgi:hypothetical protein